MCSISFHVVVGMGKTMSIDSNGSIRRSFHSSTDNKETKSNKEKGNMGDAGGGGGGEEKDSTAGSDDVFVEGGVAEETVVHEMDAATIKKLMVNIITFRMF